MGRKDCSTRRSTIKLDRLTSKTNIVRFDAISTEDDLLQFTKNLSNSKLELILDLSVFDNVFLLSNWIKLSIVDLYL